MTLKGFTWLYAFSDNVDWILMSDGGLKRIVENMESPSTQHPSIILMVGDDKKHSALEALLPEYSSTDAHGLAQLSLGSLSDGKPMIIADVDIKAAYGGYRPPKKIAGQSWHRANWASHLAGSQLHHLVNYAFGRLLLFFTDVVCLFVDDFETPQDAMRQVQQWANCGPVAQSWRPRLLALTERTKPIDGMKEIQAFNQIRQVTLENTKGSIWIQILQDAIRYEVDQVRNDRESRQLLFSATHLNAFFEIAVQHTARSITTNFDLIQSTRKYNQVDHRLGDYLEHFIRLCQDSGVSQQFVQIYVSSALVMDSCPPSMHRFDPHSIYQSLYARYCHLEIPESDLTPVEWSKLIEFKYCKFSNELNIGKLLACEKHKRVLQSLAIDWKKFRTSQVCLFCLRRKPEHVLQCGHSLCEVCVRIFGKLLQTAEYSYVIKTCILCQDSRDLLIRLKPPTAGTRLLVLDGGGIRGAFTLQALQELEKARNLPHPIYDEFDLALGTSSGGLIVLMFLLRRSIQDCIATFDTLAKKVFLSFIPRFLSALSSIVTDSLYGAGGIESCVKKAYGPRTLLFSSFEQRSALKCAVTTMTVSDTSLCLLTNYSGVVERRGYRNYRPMRAEDEVLMCDAARATSAAPSYFPAKFIPGLGFAQDGGAGKYNSPIGPAEWESDAIWQAKPDLLCSIGTGYARSQAPPAAISKRLSFRDRFFPRLVRLFLAVLDAQSNWNEHLNWSTEDERRKKFRINIPLDNEPELDDISKLAEIKLLSQDFLKHYDFTQILQAMSAASFFLELHTQPIADKGQFLCSGAIRCRNPSTKALIVQILQDYPAASFTMDDNTYLGALKDSGLCITCGIYRKQVQFSVYSLQQVFSIYLHFNPSHKWRISGFPQCSASITAKQMLDADFGRPDHQTVDYKHRQPQCECKPMGKRTANHKWTRSKRAKH